MLLYDNLEINQEGHLTIGGLDTVALAEEYGNPLYVMDEDQIRRNCRVYTKAMNKYLPEGSQPLYAGKALCFKGLYPIIQSEGFGADVVSPGEIYTALAGGFDPANLYYHGTAKTDWDINYAIDNHVGWFIVDNYNELEALDRIAGEKGIIQDILLRITVGIDPHTQEKINTGRIDSQFGVAVDTGQAAEFVKRSRDLRNVRLHGFHSHIGSQIFETQPFLDQVDKLMDFVIDMRSRYDFTAEVFNLGGGFGVRYTDEDPQIDIEENIRRIGLHLMNGCAEARFPMPRILLEPGRSIAANAGLTLYKTTGVKEINGYLNYVTVDGGMTDNIRFALYRADYELTNASRMNDAKDYLCTVAGRCCESGDRIAEDICLQKPQRGDIIAVLGTGAYNYAMASNYNRVPKPAMAMVSGGDSRLVIRAQTFEDMIACEL
ncbi:MAG: diaminopimelate decarboxylase [Firmicutes bacterium]|nr:diaminopimelate decarboxylase [Bacillota bacterium]